MQGEIDPIVSSAVRFACTNLTDVEQSGIGSLVKVVPIDHGDMQKVARLWAQALYRDYAALRISA